MNAPETPMPPIPTSTQEWAPQAFDDFFRAEYPNMVRLGFVMLGSNALAEEAAQDAFAKVYERWNRLDRPGAYLNRCMVNRCRDLLRRRRTADRALLERPQYAELGADHLLDALSSLSPRRRAAVALRYYFDLPEVEIAAALGVPQGTVKSMLHRSLAQLREVLEP